MNLNELKRQIRISPQLKLFISRYMSNKKVLLRERKRHTARRVVSTPSVVLTGYLPVLTWPGGYPARGVPYLGTHPSWPGGTLPGGYPIWVPPGRVLPLSWPGGVPCWGVLYLGTPPVLTWQGTPPPPTGPGWVPPPSVCPMAFWVMLRSIMGYGYPPCGQTEGQTRVKTLPSRRTTYGGGN